MSRWFRFYADAMRNPKVLRLSDKDFRLWVRLLAVASENDGHISDENDLRLVLGMRLDHLKGGLDRLIRGGLIDPLEDGYEPHGWAKFQYKSDTSTERVQKHRAKRNVSETPPETEADTETEVTTTSVVVCPSPSGDALRPEHVVDKWNETAPRLGKPRVQKLTPERRQLLKARIGQYELDDFVTVFGKLERSPFLRGDTGWRGCNFDWVFKKANFQKVLEGNYDD